jgi:hypothetical protein
MQDKLGRGVVYVGCVGFGPLGGPRRCGGKNRAWEVAPMFRPEKQKKLAAYFCLVVWTRPLWRPLTFGNNVRRVSGLRNYSNNYSTPHELMLLFVTLEMWFEIGKFRKTR